MNRIKETIILLKKQLYLVPFHIRNDDEEEDEDAMRHGVCQMMTFVDGGGGGLERPKIRRRHL